MAEKVSREFQRLGISGTSDLVRKRRERRRARQKLRGDFPAPDNPHRPLRNVDQISHAFDLDWSTRPFSLLKSTWGDNYEMALYCKLGLHCHNLQNGTNFKFVRYEKYHTTLTVDINYYITLEAMNPNPNPAVFSFQTFFADVRPAKGIYLCWMTLAARIKCTEPVLMNWFDTAIDDFYKGAVPEWFSDHDLASDPKRFYKVQESELHDNDSLRLFSEIAFFSKSGLMAPPLLKIKEVVIETKEEYTTESCERLKVPNAIFYISYEYIGDDPSAARFVGDHKAVLRKTMDGKPGHICIEVAGKTEEEEEEE